MMQITQNPTKKTKIIESISKSMICCSFFSVKPNLRKKRKENENIAKTYMLRTDLFTIYTNDCLEWMRSRKGLISVFCTEFSLRFYNIKDSKYLLKIKVFKLMRATEFVYDLFEKLTDRLIVYFDSSRFQFSVAMKNV